MFNLLLRLTVALTIAALVAGLQPSTVRAQARQSATDSSTTVESKAALTATAVLRPGDMVRLQIWREEDLSGDYPVNMDGVVVFPLIGPIRVSDESLGSLRTRLIGAYREYLTHESIEVLPLRRINVLGSVGDPGLHRVDETMTIADVLALAGGTTSQGDPDRIELIRNEERITTRLSQGTLISELAIRTGDQIYVPERSWVSRNASVVASVISASVSLVIALFIRR